MSGISGNDNAMEQIMAQIDLERPELKLVKHAWEKGDQEGARRALLDYYRIKRQERCLDFWDMRGPEAFPKMPWDASPDATQIWKNTPERVVEGYLYASGHNFDFSTDDKIKWRSLEGKNELHIAGKVDPYVQERLLLRRMYWLRFMDMAYLRGDEEMRKKASQQFVRLIESFWMQPTDEAGEWALTAAIRVASGITQSGLIRSWYVFLDSPEISEDFKIRLLDYIVSQCDGIVERAQWAPWSWGLSEGCGIGYAGMLFPEFSHASLWREKCFAFLNRFLTTELHPDGTIKRVHFSPIYHGGTTIIALVFVSHAVAAGYPDILTPEARRSLELLIDWMACVEKPDHTVPEFACSDIQGFSYWLKMAAATFNRPDWLYVAAAGKEGKPPKHTSTVLPYAGAFLLRDGYQRDSMFSCFFNGGQPDGQMANLTMDLYAFGRTFVTGCGRYGYFKPEFAKYFINVGYNTLMVDGSIQSVGGDITPLSQAGGLGKSNWFFSDEVDAVWGSHLSGFDKAPDVRHQRGIVFVKGGYWVIIDRIMGERAHDFSLRWLLTPSRVVIESDGLTVHTVNMDANVRVLPLLPEGAKIRVWEGSRDPLRGWFSPENGVIMAAPQLEYSWHAGWPCLGATVFVPYKNKMPSVHAILSSSSSSEYALSLSFGEGRIDRFLLNTSDDGSLCLERKTGKGDMCRLKML